MKKILLLLIFLTLSFSYQKYEYKLILGKKAKIHSVAYYKHQLNNLSEQQLNVAKKTYVKALQFNLQNTMTAIAFKESSFGLNMYNTKDGELGSFGVFHNLVKSVYERYISVKPLNKNDEMVLKLSLGKRLIEDYDFSFTQALAELKYWENYSKSKKEKNNWKMMIIRYNGGWLGNKKVSSIKYYYEIVNIIKALRQIK